MVSHVAARLGLRRAEIRTLVGCASAGAISAAFGAPLTGAFYGFELIIGTYTVAAVAPVMTASLAASLTASWLGAEQNPIEIGLTQTMSAAALAPYLFLGILGALAAVTVMQLVTSTENLFRLSRCRSGCARLSAEALSDCSPIFSACAVVRARRAASRSGWLDNLAGAGASLCAEAAGLRRVARLRFPWRPVLRLALSGGHPWQIGRAGRWANSGSSRFFAALRLAGRHGLTGVGVVGGPLTMSFLVLETTRDSGLPGRSSSPPSSRRSSVRETFGYSFSTWRLHLRGETDPQRA